MVTQPTINFKIDRRTIDMHGWLLDMEIQIKWVGNGSYIILKDKLMRYGIYLVLFSASSNELGTLIW